MNLAEKISNAEREVMEILWSRAHAAAASGG